MSKNHRHPRTIDVTPSSARPTIITRSAPNAGPQKPTGGITPKFILGVARRWSRLAFSLGALLMIIVVVVVYFVHQPVYEASTWLRIRPSYLVFEHREDRAVFVQTQRELIKSPPVIAEALANPEIAALPIFADEEDRVTWLRSEIIANPVGNSELFLISLRNQHRESVAKVVNAVRDAYLATLNTEVARQNESTLSLLEAERSRRYIELQNDRDRMRQLTKDQNPSASSTPAVGMNKQQLRILSPVDVLQQQLSQVEVDRVVVEAELQALKDSMKTLNVKVHPEAVDQHVEGHPQIITLLAEIERKEEEIAKMASVVAPTSQRITMMREALADVHEKIAEVRKDMAPEAGKSLIEKNARERENHLSELETKRDQLKLMSTVLTEKLNEARHEAQAAGESSLEIQFLQEDLARKEGVYSRIVDRIESIKTESRALSRVTTLQEATMPLEPMQSGLIKMTLAGALAAFFLPLGCFVLWEYRAQPVADLEELTSASNLRIFGEIATLPVRSKLLPGSDRKFEESLVRFEESIDSLRTSVLLARERSKIRSLVIASAGAREGKSTIAAHLASSLAQSAVGRVLLIDADMRRPHLHHLVDQPLEPGLVDTLDNRCDLKSIVREIYADRLDFVPAGSLNVPVGALLSGGRFEQLLRQAEEEYDFVIVDVPPILPVSDGVIVAKCADAAVFCALRDVSPAASVAKACERLQAAGVNVIGAVFNGVPSSSYGSSAYYYYRNPHPRALVEGSV